MTRSQFKVRTFFAHHPVIVLLSIVAVLMLVSAGAAILVQPLFKNQSAAAPTSGETPEPSSPSTPLPTETSTAVAVDQEEGDDENEQDIAQNDGTCELNLTQEEYKTFTNLVLDYEAVFQTPPSTERTLQLATMSTKTYQAEHVSTEDGEVSSAIVSLLRDKTVMTCAINGDGSRLAAALVTIETSYIDSSGVSQIEYPELTLPLVHYSTWVMENGQWKVSEEH